MDHNLVIANVNFNNYKHNNKYCNKLIKCIIHYWCQKQTRDQVRKVKVLHGLEKTKILGDGLLRRKKNKK